MGSGPSGGLSWSSGGSSKCVKMLGSSSRAIETTQSGSSLRCAPLGVGVRLNDLRHTGFGVVC